MFWGGNISYKGTDLTHCEIPLFVSTDDALDTLFEVGGLSVDSCMEDPPHGSLCFQEDVLCLDEILWGDSEV